MKKKITDENGKVYVEKKPFYKKGCFWILAVIAIIIIGAVAGGGDDSSSDKSSRSSNSETSHKKDDRTISKNAELRKKFDAIVVGDLMSNGDGGTSLTDVEKSLGKPVSTSTTNLKNVKVKDETWTKDGVTVTVQFNDDKTVSKDITGFKFTRSSKLDLKAFDSIADGANYDDVVKQYGEPDNLNEMKISGETTLNATWVTGTKGGTATLMFENGGMTSKTQVDLK